MQQMVGPGRVERPTSRLSGVRSNHLSYEPEEVFDETSQGPRETDGIALTRRYSVRDRPSIRRKRKGNEGGGKGAICLVSIEKSHERD